MKAQTSAQQDAARSAEDNYKLTLQLFQGSRVAFVSFNIRFYPPIVSLEFNNSGIMSSPKVTAVITVSRHMWPSKAVVDRPVRLPFGPEPLQRQAERKFSVEGISKSDWDAIGRGEQYFIVQFEGSYENGVGDTVMKAPTCEASIFMSDVYCGFQDEYIATPVGGIRMPCDDAFYARVEHELKIRNGVVTTCKRKGLKPADWNP